MDYKLKSAALLEQLSERVTTYESTIAELRVELTLANRRIDELSRPSANEEPVAQDGIVIN